MFLNEKFLSSNTLSLYTDSAQSLGYGAIYSSKWLYGMFPPSWQAYNITFLELYPIVLAVNIWGSLWKNHCILFFTDNEALSVIINKQTSTDTNIMKLLRCLVLACLQYNVLFQAKHISGRKNVLADALSRQRIDKFKELSPQSSPSPTPIPVHLQPENIFQYCLDCYSLH